MYLNRKTLCLKVKKNKKKKKRLVSFHTHFISRSRTPNFDRYAIIVVKYHMVGRKTAPSLPAKNLNKRESKAGPPAGEAGFLFGKTICICGSFKFYQEMGKAAATLRSAGFNVIVPQPSHIRHGHKPQELKAKYDKKTLTRFEGEGAFAHLSNIRKSDIVYIFNKGSYLGPAVTVEIGFSLALGKPIFAKAPIEDITVTNFIKAVVSPKNLPKFLG